MDRSSVALTLDHGCVVAATHASQMIRNSVEVVEVHVVVILGVTALLYFI